MILMMGAASNISYSPFKYCRQKNPEAGFHRGGLES